MMTHRTFIRTALAAVLVAAAVAGCGTTMGPQTPVYEANMAGWKHLPASGSSARGSFEASWNENTGELSRWNLTYEGLTGPLVDAQIHDGESYQNGRIVLMIPDELPAQRMQTVKLTPAQAADLKAGRLYVNLTTKAFPEGEIRGQLRPRK